MRASRFMIISLIGIILAAGLIAAPQARAEIYGLKSQASTTTASTSTTYLFKFQEDGSQFTTIGNVTLGGSAMDADGLAYNGAYGLLAYQLNYSAGSVISSQLISLNPSTAAATAVGTALSDKEIRGAAFIGSQLWVVDVTHNQLVQINPTSGVVIGTPTTMSGATINDFTDLAMAADGKVYLGGYSAGTNTIYQVNLATGALTTVGSESTSGNAYAGLAFSPTQAANKLFNYEVNGYEDIDYWLLPNVSPVYPLYTNIPPSFNAGRGDLASAVPIPPSVLLLGPGLLGLLALRRKLGR